MNKRFSVEKIRRDVNNISLRFAYQRSSGSLLRVTIAPSPGRKNRPSCAAFGVCHREKNETVFSLRFHEKVIEHTGVPAQKFLLTVNAIDRTLGRRSVFLFFSRKRERSRFSGKLAFFYGLQNISVSTRSERFYRG